MTYRSDKARLAAQISAIDAEIAEIIKRKSLPPQEEAKAETQPDLGAIVSEAMASLSTTLSEVITQNTEDTKKMLAALPQLVEQLPDHVIARRLDTLIAGFENLNELLKTWQPVIESETTEPVELYKESPRVAGTVKTMLMNWTRGKRLAIRIHSTLDQAVTCQVIGGLHNTPNDPRLKSIGGSFTCAAEDDAYATIVEVDWLPFIGVTLTLDSAPTAGDLKIEAVTGR